MASKRRRRGSRAHAGLSPGTLIIPPGAAPTRLRLSRFGPRLLEVRDDLRLEDMADGLDAPEVRWLEIEGLGNPEVFARLSEVYAIPRLVLEDVLNGGDRSKVEAYEEGLFMVLSMPRMREHLEIDQVSLFLRGRTLISFVERDRSVLDGLHERLRVPTSQTRQSGVDFLAYRITDFVVDSYFPIVDNQSERLEKLEHDALDAASGQRLRELYAIIDEVRNLRRAVLPLHDSITSLRRDTSGTFQSKTMPFLRDVEDHAARLVDLCDYNRDFAIDIRELIHGSLNLRMSNIMRILAAVSAIFIPLSFVTGIYGMNFVHMPELEWRYGYLAVLVVLGLVAFTAWHIFRRHGWIRLDQE
jgi:magnesium transporter